MHIDLRWGDLVGPRRGAHSAIAVPGQFAFIKRWKLALVLAGVLAGRSAFAGAGMYFWWFHAMDKTWVEFAALVFVIVCGVVAALLVAMVDNPPCPRSPWR